MRLWHPTIDRDTMLCAYWNLNLINILELCTSPNCGIVAFYKHKKKGYNGLRTKTIYTKQNTK